MFHSFKFIFKHSDDWACCQKITSDIIDACITPSNRQKGIEEDKIVLQLYKALVKSPFKYVTFDHMFTLLSTHLRDLKTLSSVEHLKHLKYLPCSCKTEDFVKELLHNF